MFTWVSIPAISPTWLAPLQLLKWNWSPTWEILHPTMAVSVCSQERWREGGRKHTLETESRCAGNEGPLVFRSSKESEACVIESKCFEWRIQHVADAWAIFLLKLKPWPQVFWTWAQDWLINSKAASNQKYEEAIVLFFLFDFTILKFSDLFLTHKLGLGFQLKLLAPICQFGTRTKNQHRRLCNILLIKFLRWVK